MRRTKILELGFKAILTSVLITLLQDPAYSQDGSSVKLLEFKYGFQAPFADLKTRFGGNNAIGISFQSADLNSTVFFGIEGIFIYGSTVKEDVLLNLRTFDGSIIGIDGHAGDVSLKQRGFYLGLDGGKIFKTTSHKNNLTGIRAQLGAGLLQHKIRVQDNLNTIAALNQDYNKGYDRLSNGIGFHLGLGYQYDGPNNNFHFNIMGDLYGAATASRRDFDFLTGEYLNDNRTDILAGVSVAYVVSISRTKKADNIYY